MKKPMFVGGATAVVTAILFHLIIVGILGALFATVFSGLTILDPLYANDRVSNIWHFLGAIMTVQLFQTFISASISGLVVGVIAAKLQSCWVYLLSGIASAGIHIFFLLLLSVTVSIFTATASPDGVWGLAFSLATAVGFLIGVITAVAVRKWGV